MNGESTDNDVDDVDIDDLNVDDSSDDDSDDDDEVVLSSDDDDEFGDTVVGANVDALVARMDSKDADEVARRRAARKRLEDLNEAKTSDLDSTFNFNLDDDL